MQAAKQVVNVDWAQRIRTTRVAEIGLRAAVNVTARLPVVRIVKRRSSLITQHHNYTLLVSEHNREYLLEFEILNYTRHFGCTVPVRGGII